MNSRSSLLFSLIKDRVIDSLEVARLESGYYLNPKDTIWNRSLVVTKNKEFTTKTDSTMSIWDMETFCDDLTQLIRELPVEVEPKVAEKSTIKVKTGEKSFWIVNFNNN